MRCCFVYCRLGKGEGHFVVCQMFMDRQEQWFIYIYIPRECQSRIVVGMGMGRNTVLNVKN